MTSASQTASKTEWQGIGMVLLGAFCFSLAIPLLRWTEGLDSRAIACFRALFGFLFLCTLLVRQREALHPARYRASWGALLVSGLLMAFTVALYTYAVRHTTAAIAVLLVNSAPVYVAVLSPWLLGEPRSRYTWISLGLAALGMVLVSDPAHLNGGSDGVWGVLAAALSGLTYGSVMLAGRRLSGRVTGLTQTLWGNGITFLLLLPWALQAPLDQVTANLHLLAPMGVLTIGLSYLLYFMGLARTNAQTVSVVSLFEPVSGIIMAVIFFNEVPNVWGILGSGLILFSIFLITRR